MNDLLRIIRTTGIYLIGNVLTKSISFLILPLLTKYLTPEEYGKYDLYLISITFFSSIFFLDIWGGVLRFMFDYKEKREKSNPVIVGIVIFGLSTIIYSLAVLTVGNILNVEFISILLVFGFFSNLQQLVGHIARGYGKDILFAVGGLIGALVTILFNVIFIALLEKGFEYLFISSIIGFIINSLIISSNITKEINFRISEFNLDLFKNMLFYSLPFSLNSIAWWFLNSYNRVVISKHLSTMDNGLYAVAIKFGIFIQLFVQCFQMAWQELSFSKADISGLERDKFYSTAFHEFLKFLSLGMLLLLPTINIILPLMVDSAYFDSKPLIPLILVATCLSCVSSFVGSICGTLKQSKNILYTTIYGSLINITIIHLLIVPVGLQSASIALSIGNLVVIVFRLKLIKKFIRLRVNYIFILKIIMIFVCCSLIYLYLNTLTNAITLVITACAVVIMYKEKIGSLIRIKKN